MSYIDDICLTSAPMGQKSQTRQTGATKAIKYIRRATRKQYSAEEKIRIVLDGQIDALSPEIP